MERIPRENGRILVRSTPLHPLRKAGKSCHVRRRIGLSEDSFAALVDQHSARDVPSWAKENHCPFAAFLPDQRCAAHGRLPRHTPSGCSRLSHSVASSAAEVGGAVIAVAVADQRRAEARAQLLELLGHDDITDADVAPARREAFGP
jgi:hypothetical protein